MTPATERRRPLSHDEILRVAAEIFRDNGYRATSLQQVADYFGVKRPALYYWFPSKADILVEIHRRFLAALHEQLDSILESAMTVDEKLVAILTGQVELFAGNIAELAVFISNEVELPADARGEVQVAKRRYQAVLQDLYRQGVSDGVFAELDPQIAVSALLGMTNWMFRWFRPDGRRSAQDVADVIGRLARHGYLAPTTLRS